MKIFLDANIFVAACGSDQGASNYFFRIASKDPSLHLLTSPYAIVEARRNIEVKLSPFIGIFPDLINHPSLTIISEPPGKLVTLASSFIVHKDAPILAAALFCKSDILCTLDKKDFWTKSVKTFLEVKRLRLMTPGDVLKQWRG